MADQRKRVPPFRRPFKAVPLRAVRSPPPLRFWEPRPPGWRQAMRQARPGLLVIALATLAGGFYVYDRASRPPPVIGEVAEIFTRCGHGRALGCVIDGDTFKLGERTIRVVGIDAAELDGQCPGELAQAEASTRALQDWLNRGPFTIASDPAEARDKYGRELMTVTRADADGHEEALADYMTGEGGAHEYAGGTRGGWC